MTNRRDFLKTVAAGTAAAVAAPTLLSGCQKANAQVIQTRNNPSYTDTARDDTADKTSDERYWD